MFEGPWQGSRQKNNCHQLCMRLWVGKDPGRPVNLDGKFKGDATYLFFERRSGKETYKACKHENIHSVGFVKHGRAFDTFLVLECYTMETHTRK